MKKILTVIGTRPEAIKMAPLIKILNNSEFEHKLCLTGQHKELLTSALDSFNIKHNYSLDVMQPNQSLSFLTSKIIFDFSKLLDNYLPDLVIVHGDTTTSFACALASFYKQIKVAHVEAGLRTFDTSQPFPEELNRQMTAKIASLHFAPTQLNYNNLIKENINKNNIFITGNTIIDALNLIVNNNSDVPEEISNIKDVTNSKFILVTAHRRENFGQGFENICQAIAKIADENKDLDIIFPVHPNPNVRSVVSSKLINISNIKLLEPLSYESFIFLLSKCQLVITDSGGIQEEAATFNKSVVIMRETTERQESIDLGLAILSGSDPDKIYSSFCKFYFQKDILNISNPYGDGTASQKIYNHIKRFLS